MANKLTPLQYDALQACVDPWGAVGVMYWAKAKVSRRAASGARRTLSSLERMGLVRYENGWVATDEGYALVQPKKEG